MPERVLEFASYQAMIACVAAGTGFAVVPKSVLEALRATADVRQHPLPKRVRTAARTWCGAAPVGSTEPVDGDAGTH